MEHLDLSEPDTKTRFEARIIEYDGLVAQTERLLRMAQESGFVEIAADIQREICRRAAAGAHLGDGGRR